MTSSFINPIYDAEKRGCRYQAISRFDLSMSVMAIYRQLRKGRSTCASLCSSFENIPTSNMDSTNASESTYNVPRTSRGKRSPKISHIANVCRARHVTQKIQNSHDPRHFRPNIRTPNRAQKVHMIAACHLCDALPLSRAIAAISTSPMPTQPKASSLGERVDFVERWFVMFR